MPPISINNVLPSLVMYSIHWYIILIPL